MPQPTWSWIVPDTHPSQRADLTLTQALQSNAGIWTPAPPMTPFHPSRSQVQMWIESQAFLCNNVIIHSNKLLLSPGDEIFFHLPQPVTHEPLHPPSSTFSPLQVLFEDEHLIVINKPAGLTVHPAPSVTTETLVHVLQARGTKVSSIGGPLRPGVVHRLDKNTSGAMVVAKSDAAYLKLIEIFKAHDIERTYWALCYGALKQSPLLIQTRIGRHPTERTRMAVVQNGGGKPAKTTAKTLKSFFFKSSLKLPAISWVEATLGTGRTHQVRVHLTHAGCSLLGDPTYGTPGKDHPKWKILPKEIKDAIATLPGQALHARILAFTHPITHAPLRFEAEPFREFAGLLECLESC